MAKNSIRDYSATSSLNTDVQSVDISEGCAASGINNAIREVMADLKDVSSGTVALESPQADSLTVTGDLTVDTNTLYVDSTNNNVGIKTSSPAQDLHVVGKARVQRSTNANIEIVADNNTGANPFVVGSNSDTFFVKNQAASGFGTGGNVIEYTEGGSLQLMGDATIDSSGNVLVNKTSQDGAEKLSVNFNRTSQQGMSINNTSSTAPSNATMIEFRYAGTTNGSIGSNGSSTSYNTSSDHRLKENVADMTGAIDRVKALAPKRFNFIADADTTVDGFLAHEAQTVVPEAVTGTHNEVDEDGNAVMQGIDQSKLVPLLTAALKESIAKIEALEARVTALETA